MNKKDINWEKEFQKEWIEDSLKKTKSGSISYLKDKGKWIRWEIYHAHWEDYLSSSDYWKNWQEKINSFETKEEVNFYTDRLGAFVGFVEKNTRKEVRYIDENSPKQWDPETTPKLIKKELKRLETISEKDFKKEGKFANVEIKELSIEEMKNNPWFSKQLGFGLESKENKKGLENQEKNPVKKDDNSNNDYKFWTKEQLIAEINRLKVENEQLKNNQVLTTSKRQESLKQNQQRLEQLESIFKSRNSTTQNLGQNNSKLDSNSPTGLIVGGTVLALIGLVSFLVVRKNIKKK